MADIDKEPINDQKDIDVEGQKDTVTEEQKDTEQFAELLSKLDKEIFFTASSAKNKTIAVIKKNLEVQMLSVYRDINNAINQGKYNLSIEISKLQADFLHAKGFRLTYNRNLGNDKGIYTIYWS